MIMNTEGRTDSEKNQVRHLCAMLTAVEENGKVRYVCARPQTPTIIAALKSTVFQESLSGYTDYQSKLGLEKETVRQKGMAVRDFLLYLESKHITVLNKITRDDIHYYCNACLTATYQESTRVAIIYRIRQFILRMILLGKIDDGAIINVFESSHHLYEGVAAGLNERCGPHLSVVIWRQVSASLHG